MGSWNSGAPVTVVKSAAHHTTADETSAVTFSAPRSGPVGFYRIHFYLLNPLWFRNSQMRPIQV
jgi:hypothetical protein